MFSTLAVANTASVSNVATTTLATSTPIVLQKSIEVKTEKAALASQSATSSVENIVKNYFADTPLLAEVARCESTFRHIDAEGNLIRGTVNKADVGVMQINEYYHLESAKKLGYNLHNIEGNMAFAKYLYERYGAEPWSASQPCWGPKVVKTESSNKVVKFN